MLSAIVEVCCGFHLRPYKRWRRTLSRTLRRAIEGPSRSSFFGVTIFFLLPFRLFRKRRKRADCWAASSSSFFGVWWTVSFEFIFFVVRGATWPLSFDLIFFFLYFSFFFFFRGIFSLQNPPPLTSSTGQMTWRFCFFFVLYYLHFIMEFYQLTCPCFLVWNLVWNLVFDFFFCVVLSLWHACLAGVLFVGGVFFSLSFVYFGFFWTTSIDRPQLLLARSNWNSAPSGRMLFIDDGSPNGPSSKDKRLIMI